MKDFKRSLRRTARIAMQEKDEWIIKASKILKNGLVGVGIENRQAAIGGTLNLEE